MEKLYTLQETAEFLKISTRTVLRYIKFRKLEATKIGQWRISEVALQEFLNRNSINHSHAKRRKE